MTWIIIGAVFTLFLVWFLTIGKAMIFVNGLNKQIDQAKKKRKVSRGNRIERTARALVEG